MKNYRNLCKVLLCVFIAVSFSSCNRFHQIRPVSAQLESVMPKGLRSVVITAAVEIDNPAPQVTVTDIEGLISHSGKVLGRVAVDPVVLKAKSLEKYHLRAVLELDPDVTLMDVLGLAGKDRWAECVADVYFKAALKGGVSKKMAYEGIPLKKFMNL